MNELQIEHLAVCASEWGDTETESLCDEALDDPEMAPLLLSVVELSHRYQDWMERGRARGWESR